MNSSHKQTLGIDFGGTSIKLAVVNERGEIEARARRETRTIGTIEAWLDAVADAVAEMGYPSNRLGAELGGIGVGVPGFVDFGRGFIHELVNVPGWVSVPLVRLLEERFGLRAVVDNDVNAMAIGESAFGVGKLYAHAVFVTLGTGVGGAILIDHRLYRGAHSMAGEIGHVSIDRQGIPSPQGRGGLEQYIGNRQISARVVRGIEEGRMPGLSRRAAGDLAGITPAWLAAAAQEGDPDAIAEFDYVADCLATAFASITYLIQPSVFIVGGGVAQSGEILFDPLRRHLRERLSPFFAERIEVRPAQLGNDAGVIGAATLAALES
ncbi:MAG: ROK family protein [Kiritimatiellia bacterium]|nr:ROK family protein [Kiritimatiellia bacterium]